MRYVGYEQQVQALKKKLVASSIYPMMLIVVGGLVVLFLLGYVVPRFSQIYADVGNDQPLMLRLVLGWATLIENHGQAMFMALASVVAVIVYAFTQSRFRAYLTSLLWRMPLIVNRCARFSWRVFTEPLVCC